MRRREFLRHSAVISVPFLLEGCGLSLPIANVPREPRPEDPWLEHFSVDTNGLSGALEALAGNGTEFGELYFQHRRTSGLRWNSGAVLTRSGDELQGAGLRAVKGRQSGFRHTSALDANSLQASALAAASDLDGIAPTASSNDVTSFSQPGSAYNGASARDSTAEREAIADRLETLIRQAEPGVSDVEINLTVADEWILIATLDGNLVADRRPMFRLSAQAIMTRGTETQSGFAALSLRQTVEQVTQGRSDVDRVASLAESVVDRTRRLFDSRRPPEGEMPVILAAGSGGVLLHEAVAHAFEADFVREGQSPFSPADVSNGVSNDVSNGVSNDGPMVASEAVTLIDDATQPYQRGALNVDDEGVPGQRTVLVDNGRLSSLVYDKREALAAGVAVTGNGRRESYAFEPLPRASCTFIENGNLSPVALMESMERGIVAETVVAGEIEPGSGQFRFRVKHGWVVEGGRRSVPVRDFELTGSGVDLLNDIEQVANDRQFDAAGWTCQKKGQSVPVSQGMPSVLISSLGVKPLA